MWYNKKQGPHRKARTKQQQQIRFSYMKSVLHKEEGRKDCYEMREHENIMYKNTI